MSNIKCIGCYELRREVINMVAEKVTVYICPRFFPYATAISGLLRPGKGILKAVELCPEDPLSHCILCTSTELVLFTRDIVRICADHDTAWSKWLDEHPQRRAYLAPKGRARKANWIEVFREFIEDMRAKVEGEP